MKGDKFTTGDFLPTSVKEMNDLGMAEADVILFSGDAYIDHPSFGTAVIGRWLQYFGLRVAIVPQPNWRDDLRDFRKLGTPRLFFAVSAGNMDSMVNHYTAQGRRRSDDMFTPGGKAGMRPDYAVVTYTRILKQLYPDVPVVIGGIEASLRRLTHYDYWSDTLRPSVLVESGADLLVYGMAEKPLQELIHQLQHGEPLSGLTQIPQTAFTVPGPEIPANPFGRERVLLSYERCSRNKLDYAENFKIMEEESNRLNAGRLIEPSGDRVVVVNPPYTTFSQDEIDLPYKMPYTRMPHPRYLKKEPVPAYDMIRDSVTVHRGCFGGCSFCTISAHQGKQILSRSERSVLDEIIKITEIPGFHGVISDVGGPSANMYKMSGKDRNLCEKCKRPSCIQPSVCPNLNALHQSLTSLYRSISRIPGIKHVFVGSGIRYDLIYGITDPVQIKQAREYFEELTVHHVSGRLKVAPEHNAPNVLKLMRKPPFSMFLRLKADYEQICRKAGLNQQVIPYLISGHPGTTVADMAELAGALKNIRCYPEQVQEFTPTPMTLSSAIYYSGVDPYTMKPVYTARNPEEKKIQKRFLIYYKTENKTAIIMQLRKLNRPDLIRKLFGSL